MFLGTTSLETLGAFLSGLSFANLEEGEPSFWDFNRWITAYVDGISTTMPTAWLTDRYGNDRAFSLYFEYLDEYRRCRVTRIERSLGPFEPRFTIMMRADLAPRSPDIPDEVIVGQFAPSMVFFVGAVQSGTVAKDFPFFRTAREARHHAEQRWAIPAQSWTT